VQIVRRLGSPDHVSNRQTVRCDQNFGHTNHKTCQTVDCSRSLSSVNRSWQNQPSKQPQRKLPRKQCGNEAIPALKLRYASINTYWIARLRQRSATAIKVPHVACQNAMRAIDRHGSDVCWTAVRKAGNKIPVFARRDKHPRLFEVRPR